MTPHFSREELACKHCGKMEIPLDFVLKLERLREAVGFPLVVTSGYRCPEYNAQVSGTGLTGPHTNAAVDIAVSGERAFLVVSAALRLGFTGIGVQQKGAARFIHLDALMDGRPTIWSY